MKIFKKINYILFLALFSAMTLSACSASEPVDSPNTAIVDEVTNNNNLTDKNNTNSEIINSNSQNEGDTMIKINIKIGEENFKANLLNNESAHALISKMPFTLDMTDLYGNEKYYLFPNSFPTNTERIDRIHTGDLMLYRSEYLVLFYDDFKPSYSYTRLGKIEDTTGLVESLGSRNVEITFELAN